MFRRGGSAVGGTAAAAVASSSAKISTDDGEEEISALLLDEDTRDHNDTSDAVAIRSLLASESASHSTAPNQYHQDRKEGIRITSINGTSKHDDDYSPKQPQNYCRWRLCWRTRVRQANRFSSSRSDSGSRCSRVSRLVGCVMALVLCLAVIVVVPVVLYIMETRYPTVPLQLRVDVHPPPFPQTLFGNDNTDEIKNFKSCRYAGHRRRWICQSCSTRHRLTTRSSSGSHSSSPCRRIEPRGHCPSFPRRDWEDATQSTSQYDPTNSMELEYRTIRYAAGRFVYHSQPQCAVTNPVCFNLHQCRTTTSTTTSRTNNTTIPTDVHGNQNPRIPLAVYINETSRSNSSSTSVQSLSLLQLAIDQSIIRLVSDYREACLILILADTYETVAELYMAEHWTGVSTMETAAHSSSDGDDSSLTTTHINKHGNKNTNDDAGTGAGRNHLIYNMSRFRFQQTKRLSSDAPISLYHVGLAAVASDSLVASIFRTGFDQALPLPRHWSREAIKTPDSLSVASSFHGNNPTVAAVDIHRPRKWLLSFRGTVKDGPQPYYQHRWLAAEYWTDDDVLVDVRCVQSSWFGAFSRTIKEYDHSGTIYDTLMWESTFGFAPGGSGVGSYRFGEILSTGGIPVVTHDLVLPLAPEIDWSDCVVRVSEARIIDVPRQLRAMSALEIRRRQQRCWYLLQAVVGDHDPHHNGRWTSDERVTFAKSMEVWSVRIANALALQDEFDTISRDNI